MKKRATFELRLRVCYDLNGEAESTVASRLANLVDYASNRGLLTDSMAAEVYAHTYQVRDLESKKVMFGVEKMKD